MSSKQLYYVLIGGVTLSLAILFGGLYSATALLQKQSKELVAAKTRTVVLDQKQTQLTKAKADIAKYQELGTIAKNIVPQDKDQAQTVREIVTIANNTGIKLGAITFPASTLGGTKGGMSQLQPVKDISGVYSLDITVQSDTAAPVSYTKFISFLDALEHNRRTALVKGVSIQPDAGNASSLSFTLNISEYVKP
jgi:hypothetical protein